MERKIGEIFELGGEWYQTAECESCECCAFQNTKCDDIRNVRGECLGSHRSDRKPVIFKKLEKVGDPVTERGRTFQRLNAFKTGCTGCVFLDSERGCDKDHYIDGPCPNREIWVEIKQTKEDMEEKKGYESKLKTFNLELAKQGKPVCTRDGRKARIICFDLKNEDNTIVAAVGNDCFENLFCYTKNGKLTDGIESDKDLMMLPKKKEGWVNVYYDNDAPSHREASWVYDKEEEAIKVGKEHGSCYIATVRIEWEE